MALQTRGSKMAIVSEATEGTLLAPSAAGDYLALHEGYSMNPEFEDLESPELRGSIAEAASVRGLENPTASLDHFVKHSGSVGTAPEDNLLLRSVFGAEATRSTERDTVAGSTVSVVEVDSGEGSEFGRGHFLLVKHAVDPWEIRPVLSVATDSLTLGFDLANAPATGINLGRDTRFSPADTGHPTLSVWDYRGGGSVVQAMAGGRVSEMSMAVEAGQFITASYTINGISFFYNPILIAAADTYLDFNVTGPVTAAAQVEAKTYKDPHELATAIEDAMNLAQSVDTITVTYSDTTGKYTISSDGSLLELEWNTGTNTANTIGDAIGFSTAADDTGATSYEADNAIHAPGGSNSTLLDSPQTPSLDTSGALVAKNNQLFLGDSDDVTCLETSTLTATITDEVTPVNSVCAESGRSGQVTSKRMATVELSSYLTQYEAEKFNRYQKNTTVSFLYNFGTKSGSNWEEGKCGALYMPEAKISALSVEDEDGIIKLNLTLKAFVDTDGEGEVFLGFV